jgi:hypothetical protein
MCELEKLNAVQCLRTADALMADALMADANHDRDVAI